MRRFVIPLPAIQQHEYSWSNLNELDVVAGCFAFTPRFRPSVLFQPLVAAGSSFNLIDRRGFQPRTLTFVVHLLQFGRHLIKRTERTPFNLTVEVCDKIV